MFKIICWGGIGDALRNLFVFPHDVIFQKFGIRTGVLFKQVKIVSGPSALGAALEHAKPPDELFFQNLVKDCPSLFWDHSLTKEESHRSLGIMTNRIVREMARMILHRDQPFFAFYPSIEDVAWARIQQLKGNDRLLGIQTHLSGMKTKHWEIGNWKMFLRGLLQACPRGKLILLDTAPEVDELLFDERISSTRQWTISQSIRLVQQLDYLISVDSWSKYVAVASGIPQTIIVPDQRSEYPVLSAHQLLAHEFRGIYGRADVDVLGIERSPDRLTLPRMTDLSVDYLLERVLGRLRFAEWM